MRVKSSVKKNTTSNFDIAQKERKNRKKRKLVNGSTGGYFDPLRIGANPATFVRIRRNVKSFGNLLVFNSNEKAGQTLRLLTDPDYELNKKMVTKIYRTSLLIMLLWLLGGTKPVRAKLDRDRRPDKPEFESQSEAESESGKPRCLAHVDVHNLTAERVAELSAMSTHIFEATVASQSQSDSNGLFGVNFRLKRSFKGDLINGKHLDYVRMSFLNSSYPLPNNASRSCSVAALLKPGKKSYVIFAREIRNRQLVPLISPVPRNKSFVTELKKHTCHKCGKILAQPLTGS